MANKANNNLFVLLERSDMFFFVKYSLLLIWLVLKCNNLIGYVNMNSGFIYTNITNEIAHNPNDSAKNNHVLKTFISFFGKSLAYHRISEYFKS